MEGVNLPPYSFAQAFSAWHFDLAVAVFVTLLGLGYGWRVRRATQTGHGWPWWRSALFVVLGLGGIVVATMSSLAVYQHTVLWAVVVQIALLIAVVPVGLAAGDPIGLIRAGCSEHRRERLDRVLNSWVARVLTFPVVAAVLGVVVQMFVYFGPVLRPALEHSWVMNIVYLVTLAVGCLLAWPLLGEDLLPAWCTRGLRMLFAALDGLLDAIPGIVLVAAGPLIARGYYLDHLPSWSSNPHADQQMAGTMAVAVAEVVAVPLLVLVFAQWARSELRMQERERRTEVEASSVAVAEEPELERPWWEADPRFGRRTEEFRPRSDR